MSGSVNPLPPQRNEDAAHASGDAGVQALAVRKDAGAAIAGTDGDYSPLQVDADGNLRVNVVTGGGAGTQYTEGATDASITGTAAMMEVAADTLQPIQGTVADGLLVNLGTNNDVTVASLPLPTGAATSAKQDTQITAEQAIQTAVEIIDNAIAGNEMQVDIVTSALPTGASTLAEQQTQTTSLSTIAGDTTNIETAVQLIDDTVKVLGTDTYTEAATKGLVIGAVRRDADTTLVDTTNEVSPLQVDANGRLKVEAFSGEALPVTFTGSTDVATQTTLASALTSLQTIDNIVSGAGVNVTQVNGEAVDVGAGTEAAAIRVTLPTDGTGKVGLNAGTNNIGDVDILTIAAGDNNIGNVDVVTSALPTGASTLAEQQSQTTHLATIAGDTTSIQTAVELIDDTVATLGTTTYTEAATKGLIIGAVRRDADTTLVDTTNEVSPLQVDANGRLKVEAFSGEALPVTLASTTVTSISAGDNNIGNVDVLTIAAGDNNIGNVDIVSGTITTVSTLTGGGIAHDSADSGNPVKVGCKAFSPDGTTPGTAVAENDRSDAKCDLDGRVYVNTVHPVLWSYHLDTSTAQTDTSVKADPGDGFQIVVTSIIFSTGAGTACNIFFEEGASKVLGPWYLEAVAGRGVMWVGTKPITASTALTVTTSASIAQSLDVCGYVQAV